MNSCHHVEGRAKVTTTGNGRNLLLSVLKQKYVLIEHQVARLSSDLQVTRKLGEFDRIGRSTCVSQGSQTVDSRIGGAARRGATRREVLNTAGSL